MALFVKNPVDVDQYKSMEMLLKVFKMYGHELVQIGKNHDEYLCLSPFQKERTPSCRLYPFKHNRRKNGPAISLFKDFSSGVGGDVFTFIMRRQGVCFNTALWIMQKKIAPEKDPWYIFDHPSQLKIPFPENKQDQ